MPEHIVLRPFAPEDAASFYYGVLSAPELKKTFGFSKQPSMDDAVSYVEARAVHAGKPHFYDFMIVRQEDNTVIGEINAAYIAPDSVDLGYVIGPAFQGNGYACEAVQALICLLLKEEIVCFYGACEADNPASAAVMLHCGMKRVDDVPEKVRKKEDSRELIWFMRSA